MMLTCENCGDEFCFDGNTDYVELPTWCDDCIGETGLGGLAFYDNEERDDI